MHRSCLFSFKNCLISSHEIIRAGEAKSGLITFEACVERARKYIRDDSNAALNLAGKFLEYENAALQNELHLKTELIAKTDAAYFETKVAWNDTKSAIIKDNLRARGLLSSRGVFERVLQLVHMENYGTSQPFRATQICKQLGKLNPKGIFLLYLTCELQ